MNMGFHRQLSKIDRLEDYLLLLEGRGFKFQDSAISFIYFGKQYTGSPDYLVIAALENTLKAQKSFDGSFYLSLLETLKENHIRSRKEADRFVADLGMLDHC